MNQTATWEKIWRYDQFLQFHNNHFITHHLLEILRRCGRAMGFPNHHWKNIYRVQIRIGQKTVEAKGLYDTGNSLYEPILHHPVSIIEKTLAQELMDEDGWQTRLRMIPYRSIGISCGLMRGFIADEMTVFEGGYSFCCTMPVLAVANEPFGQEDGFQIILHPDLV